MAKDYKPRETYSPIGAVPEDNLEEHKKREQKEGKEEDIRAAETSRVERKGGAGLTLADEEAAAGGNRDQ